MRIFAHVNNFARGSTAATDPSESSFLALLLSVLWRILLFSVWSAGQDAKEKLGHLLAGGGLVALRRLAARGVHPEVVPEVGLGGGEGQDSVSGQVWGGGLDPPVKEGGGGGGGT